MRAVALARPLEAVCAEAVASLLDVSEEAALAAWAELRSRNAYRRFRIRQARSRVVHLPSPVLAAMQRSILERVLRVGAASPAAYAGVPGRSVLDAAAIHLREPRWVASVDVREAYASTTWGHVAAALRKRLKPELRVLGLAKEERAAVAGVLAYFTTVYDREVSARRLPLGAPTSVALFNLVCLPVDRRLLALRHPRAHTPFAYTRYVDDLVLSHADAFDEDDLREVFAAVLRDQDFRVNEEKTSYARPGRGAVHGLRWTRKGMEPTEERIRSWAAGIRRRLRVLDDPRRVATERAAAAAWLQGLDGYLRQLYERPGRKRPRALRFTVPPSPSRAGIVHFDELWP